MALSGPQRTVATTLGVVFVMGSLGFLSVPLYDLFCRVTGFGGVTQESDTASDTILDQTIKVRFDATLDSGMPWTFKPVQREMQLRIGETGLAFYEAHNPTDRPVAGTASYNVFPYEAGGYFTKIECFCFTEQVLQPGETVQMPVTFYVDPEIVEDRDAKHVQTITLGYTFYETDLPVEQARLATEKSKDVN
jgi:cytochrome c oxidase assembly protein subunit 11